LTFEKWREDAGGRMQDGKCGIVLDLGNAEVPRGWVVATVFLAILA
jgi:hypothetical protein